MQGTDSFDWHFYKLYLGAHDDAFDYVINEALDDAIETFGQAGWFFLRYFDEGGLHLRVRFRLPRGTHASTEQRLYAKLHESLTLIPQRPPLAYMPLITFRNFVAPELRAAPLRCERAVYEPEYEVFGGPQGVPIAEDLFHASSTIARRILADESTGGASRKDLVLPLLMQAVETFVPPRDISPFLERFASFWLAGNPEIGTYKSAFADKAYELIDDGIAIVQPLDGAAARHAASWREALRQAHDRYQRSCPVYTAGLADTLCFHFAHLMNNRLGISTLEESYLAVLLNKSVEHGLDAHALA